MKTAYLNVRDHINYYGYLVYGPARWFEVSDYDKYFNLDPLYKPTDMDMTSTHLATIDNMLDMMQQGISFRVKNDLDLFDIYQKLELFEQMLKANPQRDDVQEIYLRKVTKFLDVCARLCRLAHRRLELDKKQISNGSIQYYLNKVNNKK